MWKLKGLMPPSTCQALGKTGSGWGLLCASLPLPVRGQKGRQRLHSSFQVWILKETWKYPQGLPRKGSIKNKRQRGRPLNRNLQIRHHNRTVRQVGKAREGTVYHLWKAHGCWGYEKGRVWGQQIHFLFSYSWASRKQTATPFFYPLPTSASSYNAGLSHCNKTIWQKA